jgi:hypothetical protein
LHSNLCRYVELLKKTGAAPSVLLKPDGASAAEGEGGAAVAAPKSFSVKVFLLICDQQFHAVLICMQDTKKKKRAPKAGSVEDWESEAQSVSLGEFTAVSAQHFSQYFMRFCLEHARQTAACGLIPREFYRCCYISILFFEYEQHFAFRNLYACRENHTDVKSCHGPDAFSLRGRAEGDRNSWRR